MNKAVLIFLLIAALLSPALAKTAPKESSHKSTTQVESKTSKDTQKEKSKEKQKDKQKEKQTDKQTDKQKKSKASKSTKSSKKSSKKSSGKIAKDDESPSDSTKKVSIKSDDPKAFTKALLYEKQGVEVEFVDATKKSRKSRKKGEKKPTKTETVGEYFDFSTMLIPITHEARLGSPYGIRDHRLHRGVDIQVEKGEPMVAAYPGEVIVSKYNQGGYGHYVLVQHENGLQTLYGHLAERTVKVGDQVYPGDIVGLAGNTGKSSGAHLHFEIRYGDVNIDPTTVVDFPHWQLKPGVEKYSKKKAIQAHRKIQSKLKVENVYIVKKGDTVADVAAFFYISEDAVRRINKLGKDQPLKVGMKLKGCM